MENSQTMAHLNALFLDESALHQLLTEALPSKNVRLKVFPFLLHSQRAIESALRQPRPNLALLRVYQAWRSLPTATRSEWRQACRSLLLLQFTLEAQQSLGKCKRRKMQEALAPLRALIPSSVVSEEEFSQQPFLLFTHTCLAAENIWVQPPLPKDRVDSKEVKSLLGRSSAVAVVHKLELVKVCVVQYVQELVARPSLRIEPCEVLDTVLELRWQDCRLLRTFETRCHYTAQELLLLLNRVLRARLEAWDQGLFETVLLKLQVIHTAVTEVLRWAYQVTGQHTEMLTAQRESGEVLVLVVHPASERREVRALPWGVLLVAL